MTGVVRPATPPAELPARVLVTGAGGAIGRVVLAHLAAAGVETVALDRAFPTDLPAHSRHTGDVTDADAVTLALEGCDAVCHLAAYASPGAASSREVFRVNATGTFTVLSLAGERGITRMAIASSINANGLTFHPDRPLPRSYPIRETEPARIADWYSLSKADNELAAGMAAERWSMAVVCLRLPHTANTPVLTQIAERNRARPWEAVQEGWAYLHSEDAASAFLAALAKRPPGVLSCLLSAEDTLIPWGTRAALDRFASGTPIDAPLEGRSAAVDWSLARRELAWRPRIRVLPTPAEPLDPVQRIDHTTPGNY